MAIKRQVNRFGKYIEEEIYNCIDNLKPEVKSKAVFRVSEDEHGTALATTDMLTKPPVVTFYINQFITWLHPQTQRIVKDTVAHELIHCIQADGGKISEYEAYGKQGQMNFWEE